MEYEVEISKDKERGVAILKIFGPSAKKGCTLMINKSKKFEVKFVEILTFDNEYVLIFIICMSSDTYDIIRES